MNTRGNTKQSRRKEPDCRINIVTTQKGAKALMLDNEFVLYNPGPLSFNPTLQTWAYCGATGRCTSRVHTREMQVTKEIGKHSHLGDLVLLERLKTLTKLGEDVKVSKLGVARIYKEHVNKNIENRHLPSFNSIKSSLYRSLSSNLPANPRNIIDINENDNFYLIDNDNTENIIKCKDNNLLIISSETFYEYLVDESNEIFYDGTFFCCPELFFQLTVLRLYLKKNETFLTVAYGLLSSKNEKAHSQFFNESNNLVKASTGNKLISKRVHCDYEQGIINVLTKKYNQTPKGCYFHFAQELSKNIKTLGLSDQMINIDHRKEYLRLKYLSCALVEQIEPLFKIMKNEGSHQFKPFYSYFEKQWMKHKKLRT